jgi:hypothetical protein
LLANGGTPMGEAVQRSLALLRAQGSTSRTAGLPDRGCSHYGRSLRSTLEACRPGQKRRAGAA